MLTWVPVAALSTRLFSCALFPDLLLGTRLLHFQVPLPQAIALLGPEVTPLRIGCGAGFCLAVVKLPAGLTAPA